MARQPSWSVSDLSRALGVSPVRLKNLLLRKDAPNPYCRKGENMSTGKFFKSPAKVNHYNPVEVKEWFDKIKDEIQ